MADIERLTRNIAVNQEVVLDASPVGGVVVFDNTLTAWLPLAHYDGIVALIIKGIALGNLTAMTVRGATDAAGTGAATVCALVNPPLIMALDQVGMIEVSSNYLDQQYRALTGNNITHVNIAIAATDPGAYMGTLIRHKTRYAWASLTIADETAWV